MVARWSGAATVLSSSGSTTSPAPSCQANTSVLHVEAACFSEADPWKNTCMTRGGPGLWPRLPLQPQISRLCHCWVKKRAAVSELYTQAVSPSPALLAWLWTGAGGEEQGSQLLSHMCSQGAVLSELTLERGEQHVGRGEAEKRGLGCNKDIAEGCCASPAPCWHVVPLEGQHH